MFKKTLLITLATILAMIPLACSSEPAVEGQIILDLSPAEARTMIQENLGQTDFVLLDVRTPSEFAAGHIEGAVLLDFNSGNFQAEAEKLDKNKRYLVYCRTSNRSGQAVNLMKNLGFMEVYDLDGGIVAWEAAGYPVVR
ncbi:Rhodanese domain protein [Dehalogenimonas lykanthroporepellens BL-DC-9]|nr:Rhodanese domain protein [Dehalogenimonas lykanthroporepellens BL-DC-9]